jgi:FixJ family two-component response regulator
MFPTIFDYKSKTLTIKPGESGIQHLPVILISAWGSIQLAVEGMRASANDFIT